MTDYEIVPATGLHVGPLIGNLGVQADQLTVRGIRPRRLVRGFLAASIDCETALLGSKPVAMWGFVASTLSAEATVWLCLSDSVRSRRLAIIREARRRLLKALDVFAVIHGSVAVGDDRSLRFARFLGFEVDEGTIVEGNLPYHPTKLVR